MSQLLNAPMVGSTGWVVAASSDLAVVANNQEHGTEKKTRNYVSVSETAHQYFTKPENFIWLELSLVREVEAVFIERTENMFEVVIVVDSRDEALRDTIYDREAEIIDAQPAFDFNFRILTRLGRPESELNIPTVAAYRRR